MIATEPTVAAMAQEAHRPGVERLTVARAAAVRDVGGGDRLIEAVERDRDGRPASLTTPTRWNLCCGA